MGGGEKKSSGTYETFDSGSGPIIPDSMENSDFAHKDSMEGLSDYTLNKINDVDQSIPEVPTRDK